MSCKLFVVSDVHGHYTALVRGLEKVGFDANNEEHVLVSCGDLFDRGVENSQVYDFLKGLPRKILIRGNHEDMLYESLCQGCVTEDAAANDTNLTIIELLGSDAVDENGKINASEYGCRIQELIEFIDSMQDYYEAADYVFTHGWLPVVFDDGRYPRVDPLWRRASEADWSFAHWLEWQQFYPVGAMLDGKVIVCGHRPSRMGYMFDESRANDCNYIFYGNGLIVVDSGTVKSRLVNVLVIEL